MGRQKSEVPTKTDVQKMLNKDSAMRDYHTRKKCSRCGRSLPLTNYFKDRTGTRIDLCKTCLTANIDNRKPSTFMWILEMMDVPYVEPLWIDLCKQKYKKDPAKFGPSSVLGTYIRSMNMSQFREFDYANSDEATESYYASHGGRPEDLAAHADAARAEAQERIESGEVTDPNELARLRAIAADFDANKVDTRLKEAKKSDFNEKAAREALNLAKDDPNTSKVASAMVSHKIAQQAIQEELDRKRREELERWKEENAQYVDADSRHFMEVQAQQFTPAQDLSASIPQVLPSLSSLGQIASLEPCVDVPAPASAPTPAANPPATQTVVDAATRRDAAIMEQLTEDDVRRLSIKWGESYRASEWLRMEEMYQKYANEYEISVDREQVLIQMCKVNLAMDNALEDGDVNGYSKYSGAFDQLRKSAKFTEAQNKEEKAQYLDSVGELVRAVEREGGIIPQFDYKNKYNKDKVDLTLQDMKAYTYNLVKNEMGLGDLIESYIAKLEESKKAQDNNMDLRAGLITSSKDEDAIADEWSKNLEESISADADRIFASLKEDDAN